MSDTPGICIHEEAGWQPPDPLRAELLATLRAMSDAGLNVGTAGNASVRLSRSEEQADGSQVERSDENTPSHLQAQAGAASTAARASPPSDREAHPSASRVHMLISPSGLPAERCRPQDMVEVDSDGAYAGPLAPSSEWKLHHDIYAAFPAAGAVLHAHSPFATALACQRIEIPPFHYMIARFGGDTIRCADYAIFGSPELSTAAMHAMAGRKGCLLANHGLLIAGRDLDEALALAVELEELCEQYWRACQLGQPALLTAAEMDAVLARFASYGQQPGPER